MTISSKISSTMPVENRLATVQILWIRNRINRHNYNYTELVTGDTGSGKTMTSVLRAFLVCPKRFDESCYCTMPKEFMEAVENSKKGDALVWDEAGVGLSARQWYSLSNILSGQTLQTFREKNLALFMCVPDASFIDIQARRLLNAFGVAHRYNNDEVHYNLYQVKFDRRTGQIYYPHFKISLSDTMRGTNSYQMTSITIKNEVFNCIRKLKPGILEAIEEKASSFKEKVMKKAKLEAQHFEEERFGDTLTILDYATQVRSDTSKYHHSDKRYKHRLDWKLISADFDISKDKATKVVSLVRRMELMEKKDN